MTLKFTDEFKLTRERFIGLGGLILVEIALLWWMCRYLPVWVVPTLLIAFSIVEFIALEATDWFPLLLQRTNNHNARVISEISADDPLSKNGGYGQPVKRRRLFLIEDKHWRFFFRGEKHLLTRYEFMGEEYTIWLAVFLIPAFLLGMFMAWGSLYIIVSQFRSQVYDPIDVWGIPMLALGSFSLYVPVACAMLVGVNTTWKMHRLRQDGQVLTGEILSYSVKKERWKQTTTLRFQFWTPAENHLVSTWSFIGPLPGFRRRMPEAGNRVKILYVNDKCYKVL